MLTITPIFKIAILKRVNLYSPEHHLKVIKFIKNDRINALNILARDEQFYSSKGGPLCDFFQFLAGWNPAILLCYQTTTTITTRPITSTAIRQQQQRPPKKRKEAFKNIKALLHIVKMVYSWVSLVWASVQEAFLTRKSVCYSNNRL